MLASIQQIKEISPICGADKIEKVKVLGWECIVKKNIFKEGDLCVYIEIDTLIPRHLLTDNKGDTELIRLKTVKMKGQLSQGLVLPMSILYPDIFFDSKSRLYLMANTDSVYFNVEVGLDVTEYLGVEKYNKPEGFSALDNKGSFPAFISRTDEVRIQSAPHLLDELKNKPYYATVKLDGTSATYYKKDGVFGVCSRTRELKESEDSCYWYIAKKYDLENFLPDNYAIQGEICGYWNIDSNVKFSRPIQGNKLGLKETEFFVFNIINLSTGEKESPYIFHVGEDSNWPYTTLHPLLTFKLSPVPLEVVSDIFMEDISSLLELAKGRYQISNQTREGLVFRSFDQAISFKVINNDFLLKNGE